MSGYLIFETALGHVALAWSDAGLTRLALPQQDLVEAQRLATGWRDAGEPVAEADAPEFVRAAIGLVRRYAEGETMDFSVLPFDLRGVGHFRRAIYDAALRLPQGTVTTYGELAAQAGFPGAARETGQALGANPMPLVIPCHRILAAGGRIGGFSAPGGVVTKQRLLAHEGVDLSPPPPAQSSFAF